MIGNRCRDRTAGLLVAGAVAAAGLGGATCLWARDLPRDRDAWIQVKTANFLLFSDAGERRTRAIGTELEQLRSALAELSPHLVLSAPCPTYLYVFKDRHAFTPYRFHFQGKRVEVGGYFLARPSANYMAIDGDWRGDAEHIVYHEFLHYLLRNNYSHLPVWLNEGLAEYYGSFHIVAGEAQIGLPIVEHLRWLRDNNLIPLQQLFAIDQRSKDYHEGVRQGVFYAESWALTHYLMIGNPARRPQLAQMAKLMEAGAAQEKAFAQAFGGNYDALEGELRGYVRKQLFSYERTPVKAAADLSAGVAALAWPDVLYRLGDLLLNTGAEQQPEAAEHFHAALAADPRHALAIAGLGQIEELAGRPREAQAQYEKAVRLAPDDYFVHYLLGRSLLVQGRDAGTAAAERGGRFERAAVELGRAAELAPEFGEAWSRLGLARLSLVPPPPEAVTALEKAHRLLPSRVDVTLNLALGYARGGEPRKAEAMIESARLANASSEDLDKAREALLQCDYDDAGKLVAGGKLEEAVAILERVAAATHSDDFRGFVQASLERVRQALARQRFVSAYNQALDLANHGDASSAIARLESLLAGDYPDPGDAAQARQLLYKLKAKRKSPGR